MDDVIEWYRTVLSRYAQFDGRARRKEYWSFALVNFGVSVAASILAGLLGRLGVVVTGLVALYSLAVIVPSLAVTVRRLHDTGRSGWWILVAFVPFVGWLALLVFTFLEGEGGDNQYGPDPKASLAYA